MQLDKGFRVPMCIRSAAGVTRARSLGSAANLSTLPRAQRVWWRLWDPGFALELSPHGLECFICSTLGGTCSSIVSTTLWQSWGQGEIVWDLMPALSGIWREAYITCIVPVIILVGNIPPQVWFLLLSAPYCCEFQSVSPIQQPKFPSLLLSLS